MKRMYGLLERQFRKNFETARKWRGNTGEKLLEFLERRLDNTIFRLGLSPTRALARQLVGHRHVLVDSKSVNIPSYLVRKDQVISLTSTGADIPAVKKLLDDKTFTPPDWLLRQGPAGKVVRAPVRQDVSEDINEQLIVEHYSR